ncbi:MAG: hydrolase, partial [Spirosoma sp.]|nr:hydrolase [Spirosoma sp.]
MKKNQPLNDAPKYQTWRNHLTENQIKINDVQELHIQRADKDGSVLYALLNVDASTPEG